MEKMQMPDYKNLPKLDFGIWPNQFKKSTKHPVKTGTIEMTESLLKAMLERAKAGEMPVLSVAIWERTSRNNRTYENAQLQLKPSTGHSDTEPAPPAPEEGNEEEEEQDGLPF
jgi:hypothetical protein